MHPFCVRTLATSKATNFISWQELPDYKSAALCSNLYAVGEVTAYYPGQGEVDR